jgi:hypothetical protein
MIARLKRRVRRKGKKTTQIDYLITSLTLEQLEAQGWLRLKRGYWVIESRLHHALDVTLGEDQSRVRHPNAVWVLAMFRRVVVSFALAWIDGIRRAKPKTRVTTRTFQKQFHRHRIGPARLRDLLFSKKPTAWRLET